MLKQLRQIDLPSKSHLYSRIITTFKPFLSYKNGLANWADFYIITVLGLG
jgi:hypothetical protein